MRILVLSALLVAATQAAPRFEGNTLRPRYEDLEVEPIDAVVGEVQDGEDNPAIEELAFNPSYSADDESSDDIVDKAAKTPPKSTDNSPNGRSQTVPRPESPDSGTPSPSSGTPSPDSGTPGSETPKAPSENAPSPNQRQPNSNEANPNPGASDQGQPQNTQ